MHTNACRCGVVALLVILGSTGLAVPARADTSPPGERRIVTTVSTKTLQMLREQAPKRAARTQQASEPGFFKTRKGAIAVGLMAAGAAFTVWSVNHDRKPVKSPIR